MKSLGLLAFSISALAAGVAAFAGQTSGQIRATPTPTYRPAATPTVYQPKTAPTPAAKPTPKRPDDPLAYSYFSRGNEDYAAAEYLILTRQATQGSGPKRESAIANYTKAIEIDPKFARAYMQRGMAIAMLNFNSPVELRKAIADLDTAIGLEPTATAYFERAKAKMRLARLDKSVSPDTVLSDLSEGIKLDPKSFSILNARAQIHFGMGNFPLALADVNESLRLSPLQSPIFEFKKEIEAKIEASGGNSTTTKPPTSTSTTPNDESRFKQIILDVALGKTVPADDIAWANRYEQQKKTGGKPTTTVVPSSSTTPPSAPVSLANGVFFDDFVDNKNKWGTGDTSEFVSAIADGKYQLRTKIFTFYTTILPFEAVPKIDQTRDFAIETEFTVLSGQPTYPVSLIWGVSRDLKSRHAFGLMPNRSFFKGKHTHGPWIGQLASSVPEPAKIGLNVVTKLAVKKRGSMIELYVNDIKVATTPYETFIPDSSIGFQVNGNQSVSVNYLKIAQQ